jgi:hypothetical protein
VGEDEKNSKMVTLKRLEDGYQQTISIDLIDTFNFNE